MKKIILLSMPFGALERPALGLSLLKAKLEEEGFFCDVKYLTFPFADFIGMENYRLICYDLPYTAFAGDWSFTPVLYDKETSLPQTEYERDVLQETWRLDQNLVDRIHSIRSYAPIFIEYCLQSIAWEDYSVVGFTSTFEQNIASLSLAKKIKQEHPNILTVFGGANWEAGMGHELHKCFPFVDYVCSGESEESFPLLIKYIFEGKPEEFIEKNVKGIVLRSKGASVFTGTPEMIREMDDLPYPDFSDYFRDLEESPSSKYIFPTLLFETSRGCWWGAKSHCTFCGLNGGSMSFRSKSPRRVLDELDHLTSRWKPEIVEVVDNILDMKYFDNVIPALSKAKRPFQIFYEVKSNLKREQMKLLRDAGINRIQPGIESLSNHVLKLMRKGTSGLRNLQTLKWAKEFNISTDWNLLYGFPGETADDYEEILQMLPSIRFLNPPCAAGPIRLDRFSPYFNSPEEFGLINLRPLLTYRYLYPFDTESLMRIAYYYEFDYESEINPRTFAAKVVDYINHWQQNPETGSLLIFKNADESITLLDTRSDRTLSELRLNGVEKTAYEFCDETRSLAKIVGRLQEAFPQASFSEAQVETFLGSLVANRLMVTDGLGYLSLAIRAPTLVNNGTKFENEILEDHQKPLSSYLPRELPIYGVKN